VTLDRRDIDAIARKVAAHLHASRDGFFTPQSLAQHLAVSERTVWELLRPGGIPSYRVGNSRRIDPHDVTAYLSEHREGRAA
jgi:excisionase family DNA binding protein